MFRIRRYRIFIVFSIIAVGLFYQFHKIDNIQNAGAASVQRLKHLGHGSTKIAEKESHDAETGTSDHFGKPPGGINSSPPVSTSVADVPSRLDKIDQKSQGPLQQANSDTNQDSAPGQPKLDGNPIKHELPSPADEQPKPSATPHHSTISNPDQQKDGLPETKEGGSAKEGSGPPSMEESSPKGRLEIEVDPTIPKIHWSQLPEHFPVPTDSLISLPTTKPKAIPQIQHDFSTSKKSELVHQDKLDIIKETFSFSWTGYRQKAWKQDELRPTSGKYRNPFCGWGATLVDTLDTLYLMGMEDEFEEALEAVAQTDFTTSQRNDIPLFETVIRYLGGLLSAYDISKGSHRVLLDKAVELAEILIGAFDTPNRMPMTFYLWKPTFASQPHRARTNVVLAELGSLSLEFTRLAQLTKEHKYYDAIARITNELEIWQKQTSVPGLWPLRVDASGCKKTSSSSSGQNSRGEGGTKSGMPVTSPGSDAAIDSAKDARGSKDAVSARKPDSDTATPSQEPSTSKSGSKDSSDDALPDSGISRPLANRSPQDRVKVKRDPLADPSAQHKRDSSPKSDMDPHCEPQGLDTPALLTIEEFGLGGLADSTYEYLPKEYILLGGVESQYKSMYERAVEASKKELLFRPMIADEKRSILQAGLLKVNKKKSDGGSPRFQPEGTHLTCFVGGMFAVGAKIFDRPGDLDIASKLTDGCIWAYESMKTGLMPETFLSVPCEQLEKCPWNETLWKDKLDTYRSQRESNQLAQQQTQKPLGDKQDLLQPPVESFLPASPKSSPEAAVDENTTSELKKGQSSTAKANADKSQELNTIDDAAAMQGLSSSTSKAEASGPDMPQGSRIPRNGPKPAQLEKPEVASDQSPTTKSLPKRQLGEIGGVHQNPIADKPAKELHDVDEVDLDPAKKAGPSSEKHPKGAPDTAGATQQPENSQKASVTTDKSAPAPPNQKAPPGEDSSESGPKTSSPMASSTPQKGSESSSPQSQTHEEFVEEKIKEEGLPAGMTKILGGKYLLRPEAIESVFIMYRITGKEYWRTKGWEMFKAIQHHTNSTFGASAISDVTRTNPRHLDEMESFWLAETLKYFWLLFSDPSVVSLDDYVLNTEAHPLKRPVDI